MAAAIRHRGAAQELRRDRRGRRDRPDGRGGGDTSRCSDPTAPARPRRSRSSRGTARRDRRARCRVLGMDPAIGGAGVPPSGSASCCSRAALDPYLTVARGRAARTPAYYPAPARDVDECHRPGRARRRRRRARVKTLSGGQQRRARPGARPDRRSRPDRSSTSRPPASTRAARRGAWEVVPGLARARQDHRCSPPTTWTRPSTWPTAIAVIDHGAVVAEGHAGPASAARSGGRARSASRCPDGIAAH